MEDTSSKLTSTLDNIINSYSGDYKNRVTSSIILHQNLLIKHISKVTPLSHETSTHKQTHKCVLF